jgi:pSer/pThr/pTyr-binding forkhead associated (FHA) protein
MGFTLLALNGPQAGQRLKLEIGYKIGRSTAEIKLDDAKVSTNHAEVFEKNGAILIRDLGSKNGIRFEGKRIDEIALRESMILQIGTYDFEVQITDREGGALREIQVPTVEPAVPAPNAPALLTDYLRGCADRIKDRPRPLVPFAEPLQLSVLSGIQADTIWTLYYGPRSGGSHSLDLCILEPGAPATCFELIPTPKGTVFKTNHPENVQLNGQARSGDLMSQGDIITIFKTRIEVDLPKVNPR